MNKWKMNCKQKIVYIWTYYRFWILGGILAIAMIVYALIGSMGIHKDTYLQITMVNADTVNVESSNFFDNFEELYCDRDYEKIEVDAMLRINPMNGSQLSGTAYQVLSGKFLVGEIDVFISDIDTFTYLSQNHCFTNLEEILGKEAEKYRQYFIYQTDKETDEQYPAGISLRDCDKFNKENFYRAEAVWGIGSIASNKENAVKFLNYLFESK